MSRRRPTVNDQSSSMVDNVKEDAQKAKDTAKNTLTVLWHQIPSWQQDNHYIKSGYRPPTNSYRRSFASWLYIHNETVNIYTHLIGALAALLSSIFLYHQLKPRYELATREDLIVFTCYFAGAAACLGMSAIYHTISNHSPRVNRIGNQLDYVGIVCLIWGSFIPSIYYGFGTEATMRWLYWTMVSPFPSSHISELKPIPCQDFRYRCRLCHSLREPEVPDTPMAALPRSNVCSHGSECRRARDPRHHSLRCRSIAAADRPILVGITGRHVHSRRRDICREWP